MFVPKGTIDSKSALAQVMAWRQAISWTNAGPVHWRINAALGGHELKQKDDWWWWLIFSSVYIEQTNGKLGNIWLKAEGLLCFVCL